MKVLIVDDSAVYRSRIRAALSGFSWLEIAGALANGQVALDFLKQTPVDLVVLDMEMPVMDGLRALRELRKTDRKTRVVVFSSTTVEGSEATLEALSSGADDFVTKPSGEVEGTSVDQLIRRDLLPKIEQFSKGRTTGKQAAATALATGRPKKDLLKFQPAAVVIASSTGGPAAHDAIFSNLGQGTLRCPVFIAQHMPPVFTETFARRLASCSGLPCKEATHGEAVRDCVYVAPGDFHLTVARTGNSVITSLDKEPPRNSVRPAADHLFETASEVYGAGLMGFVYTGMGEDGLAGSKAIRKREGGIMIQNAESCVVFGMPGAVFAANDYDAIGDLEQITAQLRRMILR